MRLFPSQSMQERRPDAGFTLLEVAITIGILVTLAVAVTELLSSSLEIRGKLSQSGKVSHRLSSAMNRLSDDITHSFLLNKQELQNRKSDERPTQFVFEMKRNSAELRITTKSKRPMIANAKEGDLTYVVYKVGEDPQIAGLTHLYRGETPFIPKSTREDPPMRIVAKNVKAFRIEAWRGDRWIKDRWDTARSEFRDQIPPLVRIEIDGYLFEMDVVDGAIPDLDKMPTETFSTVVHLPIALNFVEERTGSSSIRWDRM